MRSSIRLPSDFETFVWFRRRSLENLRSYYEQNYANFEILFAVRWQSDPAVPVVQRLMAEYPAVRRN